MPRYGSRYYAWNLVSRLKLQTLVFLQRKNIFFYFYLFSTCSLPSF